MTTQVYDGCFVFVVDTTTYAGNFERDLVAFVTGRFGECGVGRDLAEMALKELPDDARQWLTVHVVSLPDEHGCNRPASIWPTPGWWNDGSGKFLPMDSSTPAPPRSYPAYLSVACFMTARPSDDLLELLRRRTRAYCDAYLADNFSITGFRLLRAMKRSYVDVTTVVEPVVPMEQEVHLEHVILNSWRDRLGPVEIMLPDGRNGIMVRPAADGPTGRIAAGVQLPGLLHVVRELAKINPSFRLGLLELVEGLE